LPLEDGAVADYIPELAKADPEALQASTDPCAGRVLLKLFRNLADINMDRLKQANGQTRVLTQ